MDYAALLKEAQAKRPESAIVRDRFEVPKVLGRLEGNKTILTNFAQITSVIRRDVDHFSKYLLKELATPGVMRNSEFMLGRKVSSSIINEKIRKYVDSFVICPSCGLPDTDLLRDPKKGTTIRCNGCGANTPIKDFM